MQADPVTRRYFSKETKRQILSEHLEKGVSIAELARRHGIHAITLYNWKRQMRPDDDTDKGVSEDLSQCLRDALNEIDRHKNEIRQLKKLVGDYAMDKSILEEANAILKKKHMLQQLTLQSKSSKKKVSK